MLTIYADEGGRDVDLLYVPGAGDTAVITFSSLRDRRPFGQPLFDKLGIPAFYMVAGRDHWWQPETVQQAIHTARRWVDSLGIKTVLTYGTSMGAYGAARYSADLRADRALLIAPQFTVDPSKPPHEQRWKIEADRINFERDNMAASISKTTEMLVIYDPRSADAAHVTLFAKCSCVTEIVTPFVGHSVPAFLRDGNILRHIVIQALDGTLTTSSARQMIRLTRSQSAAYWLGMASCMKIKRPKFAPGLVQRALDLRDEPATRIALGYAWLSASEPAKALATFDDLVSQMPALPQLHRGRSRALAKLERLGEATEAAREALRFRPDSADLHRNLVRLLLPAKFFNEAEGHLEKAEAIQPGHKETASLRTTFLHLRAALT